MPYSFSNISVIKDDVDFEKMALECFYFQAENVEAYKEYLKYLRVSPENVKTISAIPFLPITFFKTREISSCPAETMVEFRSSGTTGENISRHLVHDVEIYRRSFVSGFNIAYGNIEDYCILALLPSYLENGNSSLVFMVNELINLTKNNDSGFFLNEADNLIRVLNKYINTRDKVILLGVSYALLDLVERHPIKLSDNIIVMETGGMKGRRREITREELHVKLCEGFGKKEIHSEYGMTELLSQAYSVGYGIYQCPPWMKIIIRDPYDPFQKLGEGKTGGINIIDLANYYSCSFIETQDLGKVHADRRFEVLGRMDQAQLRGCNLLVN